MSNVLKDYFDALERLLDGNPANVPKGSPLTQDSVSLEAGRKKGSIKKSRPIFRELIEAIDRAAQSQSEPNDKVRQRLEYAKAESARYRVLWEDALAREVSLFKQLWDTQEAWAKERAALTGSTVTPIKMHSAREMDIN